MSVKISTGASTCPKRQPPRRRRQRLQQGHLVHVAAEIERGQRRQEGHHQAAEADQATGLPPPASSVRQPGPQSRHAPRRRSPWPGSSRPAPRVAVVSCRQKIGPAPPHHGAIGRPKQRLAAANARRRPHAPHPLHAGVDAGAGRRRRFQIVARPGRRPRPAGRGPPQGQQRRSRPGPARGFPTERRRRSSAAAAKPPARRPC